MGVTNDMTEGRVGESVADHDMIDPAGMAWNLLNVNGNKQSLIAKATDLAMAKGDDGK